MENTCRCNTDNFKNTKHNMTYFSNFAKRRKKIDLFLPGRYTGLSAGSTNRRHAKHKHLEWFLKQKHENTKPKKSNNFYTHGIYIKGDFTNTTKYYSNAVKNYAVWKYYIGFNFCSVVSHRALSKGVLSDGKNFEKHFKYKFTDYLPFYDYSPDKTIDYLSNVTLRTQNMKENSIGEK